MNVDYLHITFYCLVSSRKTDHLICRVAQIINIIVSLKQNEGLNHNLQENVLYWP